jgi:hypothetical protein
MARETPTIRHVGSAPRRFWFETKCYGWGWGLPLVWQGWVVLAAYVALMVVTGVVFPPHRVPAVFFASVTALSALLVAVCWWTGEPPRWRWGGD